LKLKCDEPLSNVAFNFNVRRYIMTEKECTNRTVVWRTLHEFQKQVAEWKNGPVKELNAEAIDAEMERVNVEAYKMAGLNPLNRSA
jgi:hypothetical protein